MNFKKPTPEDLELKSILEAEQALLQQQKEIEYLPIKLERERLDRENTLPPIEDIQFRQRAHRFENEIATKGAAKNLLRREQSSIILILLMLLAIGFCLLWIFKFLN